MCTQVWNCSEMPPSPQLSLRLGCYVLNRSVMSNSIWPYALQPSRLFCPGDYPGNNTVVGCHALLQEIFLTQGLNPHLLHWQVDSLPLSHLGSPRWAGLLSKVCDGDSCWNAVWRGYSQWRRSTPVDGEDRGRSPTAPSPNSTILGWSEVGLSTCVALFSMEALMSPLPLLTRSKFTIYTKVLKKSLTWRDIFRTWYGPFKDQGPRICTPITNETARVIICLVSAARSWPKVNVPESFSGVPAIFTQTPEQVT